MDTVVIYYLVHRVLLASGDFRIYSGLHTDYMAKYVWFTCIEQCVLPTEVTQAIRKFGGNEAGSYPNWIGMTRMTG